MNQLLSLTSSEYEIMNIIWESKSDLSLQEILSQAEKNYSKQWKRQTVATFLSHLTKKGIVISYRQGRYFFYRALIPKEAYRRRETVRLLDFWYNGSARFLLESLHQWGYDD